MDQLGIGILCPITRSGLVLDDFGSGVSCHGTGSRKRARRWQEVWREGGREARRKIGEGESGYGAVLSKYGIAGVACGGSLIVMPRPFAEKDNGMQPFNGRMSKSKRRATVRCFTYSLKTHMCGREIFTSYL